MKLTPIFKNILLEYEQKDFDQIQYNDIANSERELKDDSKKKIFYDCKSNIEKHVDGNYIKIWRQLTVPDDWLDSLYNGDAKLGKYWAYSKEKAYSYWGNKDNKISVTIGAEVNLDQVDWEYTFRVKLQNDHNDWEQEIGLLDNADIQIEELEVDGSSTDIDQIKGMTFRV